MRVSTLKTPFRKNHERISLLRSTIKEMEKNYDPSYKNYLKRLKIELTELEGGNKKNVKKL